MRFLLLFLLFVGCSNYDGEYNGTRVEINEAFFSDSITVKKGEKKIIRDFKFKKKEIVRNETLIKTYETTDSYSCRKCGFCYRYRAKGSGFGHSCSCSGSRIEKRKYFEYDVKKDLIYKGRRVLKFKLDDTVETRYDTLDRDSCN